MKYFIPLIGTIRTPSEGQLYLLCDSIVKSPWQILRDESLEHVTNITRDVKNDVTPCVFHVISFSDWPLISDGTMTLKLGHSMACHKATVMKTLQQSHQTMVTSESINNFFVTTLKTRLHREISKWRLSESYKFFLFAVTRCLLTDNRGAFSMDSRIYSR